MAVGWCAKSSYTCTPAAVAAQLHAPGDALEPAQRLDAALDRHADMSGGGQRRERVIGVMRAERVPDHGATVAPFEQHIKPREVAIGAAGAALH